MGQGRGRRTPLEERSQFQQMIAGAITMGSRLEAACKVVGISARTLQRWKRTPDIGDGRHGPKKEPANKLSLEERTRV